MASGREYVSRLQEEIHRTVSQQLQSLESDIQTFQNLLVSSLTQVSKKIGLARGENLPEFGPVIESAIRDALRESIEGMNFLAHFAAEARRKETQEDLLSHMLDGATRYAGKVSLFVVRGDRFMGWSARGFTDALVARIRQASFHQSESAILRDALEKNTLKSIGDLSGEATVCHVVGSEAIVPWHALPLRSLGRSVAILLASPEFGQACNLEALGVLMDVTGLCIENLALRTLPGTPEPAQDTAIAEASPAPMPEVAPSIPQEEGPRQVVPQEPAPTESHEPEPEEPPPAIVDFDESLPKILEAPAEASPELAIQEPEPIPATPAASIKIEPTPPSPDEKLYADAKRFARLLVSEIKLYNEQRVREGREHRDLYVRLKRDIDRSREMYQKRISSIVATKVDYFHDELVRILGDNDPSALGRDYPGARVEG